MSERLWQRPPGCVRATIVGGWRFAQQNPAYFEAVSHVYRRVLLRKTPATLAAVSVWTLWYNFAMEYDLKIDVATLDPPHRRAMEEVIGQPLAANQRLIISVTEVEMAPSEQPRRVQSLDDWTKVYEGLSDEDIESIDKIAKTRANLTRNLP